MIVWSEEFRPKTIDDCILPEATKKMIKEAIASGNIPSFVFAGSAGTGKTSAAKAIANDLEADLLYINASLDTSIDNIRNQVVSFSSSVSFGGNSKIVLLDEGEGLSQQAMNSLKGIYESFPTTKFILTTNNLSKVLEPIKSRSVVIEFRVDSKEKMKMSAAMMKRIIAILKEKKVEFEPAIIAELVKKYFPDFRRTLNELQRHALSGKIDTSILLGNKAGYKELIDAIKTKDYKAMRMWVGENSSDDPANLFKDFYDNAFEYFVPNCVPQLVLLLSDYQFKAVHAVDQQINLAAFLTETMIQCQVKE